MVGEEVPEDYLHQRLLLCRFERHADEPAEENADQVAVVGLRADEVLEGAVLEEAFEGLMVLLQLRREHLVGEEDVEQHLREGDVQEGQKLIRTDLLQAVLLIGVPRAALRFLEVVPLPD